MATDVEKRRSREGKKVVRWSGGVRTFTRKFSRIRFVEATGAVQDEAHLLEFLSSLSWLRGLRLDNSPLNQEFYNQLTASAHSLVELRLSRPISVSNKLYLNFDFLDKLPWLSELTFRFFLSFKSLASLIRRLGKLKTVDFCFHVNQNGFCIDNRSKVWLVCALSSGSDYIPTSFEKPEEILNHFQELRASELEEKEGN